MRKPMIVFEDRFLASESERYCALNAQLYSMHPDFPSPEMERRQCEREPRAYARDFEAQLLTGFQSDSSCKGVELIKASEMKQEPRDFWLLLLDHFEPKADVQKWSLTHAVTGLRAGKWEDSEGTGGPGQMAHAVCAVMTHAGGTIRH
jgi:hypothetical protein